MKDTTKSQIKTAFGSLISNDSAIASAKNSPIWLTLIIFLLGIILPIVPVTVSSANSYGSSFISQYTLGTDKTLPKLALEMAKNNENKLIIGEDHMLSISLNGDNAPDYVYINQNTNKPEMELYIRSQSTAEDKNNFIKYLGEQKQELPTADENGNKQFYRSSYCVFFKSGIYAAIYKTNSDVILSTSAKGDYKSFKPGTNLVDYLVTINGTKLTVNNDQDILNILADDEKVTAIFNNWKQVFNTSYLSLRKDSTIAGSFIYLGIYAGMSLLMSFLLWVLTRGKSNPFNYLTILTCFKIGSWACLCPGLIGLVFGLVFPTYATMIFIMALGMRIMWMSMKQFRPDIQ